MESSPRGRDIEYVDGNPEGIIKRGEAIKELGQKMLDSAQILKEIKNNDFADGGQKGKAVEKLQD